MAAAPWCGAPTAAIEGALSSSSAASRAPPVPPWMPGAGGWPPAVAAAPAPLAAPPAVQVLPGAYTAGGPWSLPPLPPTCYYVDQEAAEAAVRLRGELAAAQAENWSLREELQAAQTAVAAEQARAGNEQQQQRQRLDEAQLLLRELQQENGRLTLDLTAERQRAMAAREGELLRVSDVERLQRQLQGVQAALDEAAALRRRLELAERAQLDVERSSQQLQQELRLALEKRDQLASDNSDLRQSAGHWEAKCKQQSEDLDVSYKDREQLLAALAGKPGFEKLTDSRGLDKLADWRGPWRGQDETLMQLPATAARGHRGSSGAGGGGVPRRHAVDLQEPVADVR